MEQEDDDFDFKDDVGVEKEVIVVKKRKYFLVSSAIDNTTRKV